MPPGPGRRRPAASAPGRAGPLPPPPANAPTEAVRPRSGRHSPQHPHPAGATRPRCPSSSRPRLIALVVARASAAASRASAVPPRSRPRRAVFAAALAARDRVALGACAGLWTAASTRLPARLRSPPGGLAAGDQVAACPRPTPPGELRCAGGGAAGAWVRGGGTAERLTASGPGAAPVRLVIPAIGVATPLVRLGLEPGGGMRCPATSDGPAGSPRTGAGAGGAGGDRRARRLQDRAGGVLPAARPAARRPDPGGQGRRQPAAVRGRGGAQLPQGPSPPTRCSGRSRRPPCA